MTYSWDITDPEPTDRPTKYHAEGATTLRQEPQPLSLWAWHTVFRACEPARDPAGDGQGETATEALQEARLARELARQADESVKGRVWAARRCGASWGDVAEALGISRQAAQQRYGN